MFLSPIFDFNIYFNTGNPKNNFGGWQEVFHEGLML